MGLDIKTLIALTATEICACWSLVLLVLQEKVVEMKNTPTHGTLIWQINFLNNSVYVIFQPPNLTLI